MNPARPQFHLQDADAEIQETARIITRSTARFLKAMDMVSETYLGLVLLALWDSGVYEYVRSHKHLPVESTATELGLDPSILTYLIEYLVGRGLMHLEDEGYALTEVGRSYWNYVTRGVLVSHVGGYLPMLVRLGPLLRKEINLDDPSLDRVGRLVASGANYTLLGSGTVDWVLEVIKDMVARTFWISAVGREPF